MNPNEHFGEDKIITQMEIILALVSFNSVIALFNEISNS